MNEKELIANRGICSLCLDVLISINRHDFVKCKCGKAYLDGGIVYIRWGGSCVTYPLYTTDKFEVLRNWIYRGSRGKNGDQELKYVKLSEISNDYLENLIDYELDLRPDNKWLDYYILEQAYRETNNIQIDES